MAYSTCCGAHTNYPEIHLCPDCLEYCDWEEEDEEEETTTPQNPNNDYPTIYRRTRLFTKRSILFHSTRRHDCLWNNV